eukprot:363628-Chlamydomonas_euryale.AAC.10
MDSTVSSCCSPSTARRDARTSLSMTSAAARSPARLDTDSTDAWPATDRRVSGCRSPSTVRRAPSTSLCQLYAVRTSRCCFPRRSA